jgi:RNA recognition motif-containing protein
MGKKLFVGGLSFNTDDAGLKAAFAAFGDVTEAKVVTDRDSGRSRGFGFVTMADEAAADKAIAEMNSKVLDGRTLNVSVARTRSNDRDDRDSGFRGGNRGGGRDRW